MGWKRVLVKQLTNFWSFLTKSPTFLRLLTLKLKNEIKIVTKINKCVAFNPKMRKWAENELWWNNRQNFVFFDQKYHFLEILDTKTQKRDEIFLKNTCVVFNPKTRKLAENELWWNNRQTFRLFYQKYHFLEILDNKTEQRD